MERRLRSGKVGDASAVPALIGALKDENSDVRMEAVDALAKVGDASAVPALIGSPEGQG